MKIQSLIRRVLICAVLLPSAAFAILPVADNSYTSGPYVGAQAGYIFGFDQAKFVPQNSADAAISKKNNNYAIAGGVYAGYGYLLDHGNIPYLGAEVGFHYRSRYNDCPNVADGCLHGKTINAQYALSFDVLPGLFFDDNKTTLVYGRLGLESDRFYLKGEGVNAHKYHLLFRAGAGIEHQLVNAVYVRLNYVYSIASGPVAFHPANDDDYYSQPQFHTLTVGLNYRFNG